MPSSLFMFLFSPELGVLLFCTAVVFIGLAGFVLRKTDRSRALVWSLEGLVLTAAISWRSTASRPGCRLTLSG